MRPAAATAATLLVVFVAVHVSAANWWLLAMPGAQNGIPASSADGTEVQEIHYKEKCNKLQYLEERQREMCGLSQHIIKAVSIGAQMSIEECQFQFRSNRWNCSTFSNTTNIFGSTIELPTREAAFVYAISAAGVAYTVSRACARGELNQCSCDDRVRARTRPPVKWQWGGCSENIHYGEKFSRDFVDARESRDTKFGLMNLHNNEAGRRSIRSRMKRVCKCHGMSGSCSVRVCWRKLPNFREVGDALSSRYEGATRVKMVERKDRRKKLRPYKRYLKPPNKTDLVFLEDSPSYCERDHILGILGTHGRLCNNTSPGMDGCKLLCCGRGYQTIMRDKEEKCHCRFIWCCNVQCETCRYKREEHMCN